MEIDWKAEYKRLTSLPTPRKGSRKWVRLYHYWWRMYKAARAIKNIPQLANKRYADGLFHPSTGTIVLGQSRMAADAIIRGFGSVEVACCSATNLSRAQLRKAKT